MNDTLFFHGTTTDGVRFTLAGQFTVDSINLGAAICSPEDQFKKRLGRQKAEGRSLSDHKRGHCSLNLYSPTVFEKYTTKLGYALNWFIGKETTLFMEIGQAFEEYSSRELKKAFSLYG